MIAARLSCSASGAAAGSPRAADRLPGRRRELVLAAVEPAAADRGRVAAGLALGDRLQVRGHAPPASAPGCARSPASRSLRLCLAGRSSAPCRACASIERRSGGGAARRRSRRRLDRDRWHGDRQGRATVSQGELAHRARTSTLRESTAGRAGSRVLCAAQDVRGEGEPAGPPSAQNRLELGQGRDTWRPSVTSVTLRPARVGSRPHDGPAARRDAARRSRGRQPALDVARAIGEGLARAALGDQGRRRAAGPAAPVPDGAPSRSSPPKSGEDALGLIRHDAAHVLADGRARALSRA